MVELAGSIRRVEMFLVRVMPWGIYGFKTADQAVKKMG